MIGGDRWSDQSEPKRCPCGRRVEVFDWCRFHYEHPELLTALAPIPGRLFTAEEEAAMAERARLKAERDAGVWAHVDDTELLTDEEIARGEQAQRERIAQFRRVDRLAEQL